MMSDVEEIIDAIEKLVEVVDDLVSECADSDTKSAYYYNLNRVRDSIENAKYRREAEIACITAIWEASDE